MLLYRVHSSSRSSTLYHLTLSGPGVASPAPHSRNIPIHWLIGRSLRVWLVPPNFKAYTFDLLLSSSCSSILYHLTLSKLGTRGLIPPSPQISYMNAFTFIKSSGLKPRYWKKKRIIGLTLKGASKDICSSQKW